MSRRDELIDYIDENYNTEENWQMLNGLLIEKFGNKVLTEIGDIDDNGPEGIYTNLSTIELEQLANALDEAAGEPTFSITLELTASQLHTLEKALSDFSDIAFTKDRQMSKDAANILRQL